MLMNECEEQRLYTTGTQRENAARALQLWTQHQTLTIYAGVRGGYAVVGEEWANRLRWSWGWHQTSPEEIEALLDEDEGAGG